MLLSNDGGVQHSGGGIEGIHSGVDTQLSKGSVQHSVGIQMSESGGWCGIGEIISGHVNSLHGGNGSLLGSCDPLLELSKISSQGRLISDSGWDTSEQGGHFRASLGEPENVVDKEEHVLVLLISEVLSDGKSGESDSSPSTWGLVHLTVHKGGLASRLVKVDNTGVYHLVVEIVSLTGPFAHTGEH
jgi:hypothetical protein